MKFGDIMNLLMILLVLILLHALYNLINYFRFNYIEDLYMNSLSEDSSLKAKALTHKTTILNYIKNSGVEDSYLAITEPIGYGKVAVSKVSVFNNLLNPRADFVSKVISMLYEAKGNYFSRFINSINPFYWLRILVFLPQKIFEYFGVSSKNTLIKFFQFLYWILGALFTAALALYPNEIKEFLAKIF